MTFSTFRIVGWDCCEAYAASCVLNKVNKRIAQKRELADVASEHRHIQHT